MRIECGSVASLVVLGLVSPAWADAPAAVPVEQRWAANGHGGVPEFSRHVQPLLGKLGCSNRACHGSFQGQGGFRLSLFGSDPRLDHDGLVKEARIDVKDPDASLALRKPSKQVPHKGGLRFAKESWEYRLLRAWIAAGAPSMRDKEAVIEKLIVVPPEVVLSQPGARADLRVRAHFSDGTIEEVTGLTQFSSNDDVVAAVSETGQLTAGRPGDTAIVVTFGGAVTSVPVLVPRPGTPDRSIAFTPHNRIDERVAVKLDKLGMVASELCSDEEFLRRASLDITGTLPTPREVLDFLADTRPDRRSRKIDELLERPAYALWWTTRLCDLTGLNQGLLGGTEFAKVTAEQWQAWIERRVRDNVGYDQLVAGILLATSRRPGQSYEDFAREMSEYTRKKQPRDFAERPQLPWFWFRSDLNDAEARALKVAHAFLGVRLECAQCHKHPFDRWTQQDFKQFTALFERVQIGIAPDAQAAHDRLLQELGVTRDLTAAQRRGLYRKLAEQGEPAPWREVYIGPTTNKRRPSSGAAPKLLGGIELDIADDADPRGPLVAWFRDPTNPYFARAWVNRVWAHYFGKGIVDPPDDLNLANPPSNPELLDDLAAGFICQGYDMKWLHRQIVGSRTYQMSWKPNPTNSDDERNFSRMTFRRLPAEVVVDALHQATAGSKILARGHTDLANRRIGRQAVYDERSTEFSLVIFGKPLRKVNCDCERIADPSLLQAVFLRNDREVLALLDRPDGWLKELSAATPADAFIREAYLRTLSRPPSAAELARCRQHLAAVDPADGRRDLLWALLNTQEFITNH